MRYKELAKLKTILALLYIKHGATDEVVKLSQFVDEIVVEKQKELGRLKYDNT